MPASVYIKEPIEGSPNWSGRLVLTLVNNSDFTLDQIKLMLTETHGALTKFAPIYNSHIVPVGLGGFNYELIELHADALNNVMANAFDTTTVGAVASHTQKTFKVDVAFSDAPTGVYGVVWSFQFTVSGAPSGGVGVSPSTTVTGMLVVIGAGVVVPPYTPEDWAPATPEQPITPPIIPVVPSAPALPWYMGISNIFADFGAWVQGGANSIVTGLQDNANAVVKSINDAAAGVWSSLISNLAGIIAGIMLEGTKQAVKAAHDGLGHSTPEKTDIEGAIVAANTASKALAAGVDATAMLNAVLLSPFDATSELNRNAAIIASAIAGGVTAGVTTEFLTLGQVEGLTTQAIAIAEMWGHKNLVMQSAQIPWEWLFFKNANHFYASKFTPEIPPYTDLVNMRVKEKITQGEFETYVAYQGFSKYWAGKIWDAHFNAPNLNDVLTAWRRGSINEARVDELMVLIDLDPFYKGVFDTRKYIDPPVNMARFMFETGAIGTDRVADLVHRAGYSESDAKAVVDYILKFQERRYRTRLLTALATGRAYGAFTDGDIRTEVKALGQTDAVADLIIRLADVRAKTEMARITHPKPRLLSLGELKRGFMHNVVDEDAIRTELLTRGYELGQVDLLVSVMNADKVVDVAGGKKAALTVSELKQAFQYNEIGEDALRQTLLLRGLDLSEVDMLINTWKKSWGVVSA